MNRRHLVFLPGLSGRGEFWQPVADLLPEHDHALVDWPGLGGTLPDPGIAGYDDLVERVARQLLGPSVLVAQSMGGVVAVQVAARHPRLVSHLVLAATSGGVAMAELGAEDWRPAGRAAQPDAPEWAFAPTPDLTDVVRSLAVPVLLVWATADALSPLAVGEHLLGLVPDARLVVLESDDHWVARIHAPAVADHIREFLATEPAGPT